MFRYDDYSSRSDPDVERQLFSAFEETGLSCTVGIVPYATPVDEDPSPQTRTPLTPDKVDVLERALRAGVVDIAQHGWSHQTVLSREQGGWTEFAGLGLDVQVERIAEGKRLLEQALGVVVRIFIPPWNSYDSNTCRALEELSFECISAGRYGTISESSHLRFLPSTCSLSDLPRAVQWARKGRAERSVIVALLHPADIRKEGPGCPDLSSLLLWLRAQGDVQVRTIGQTIDLAHGLDALQYRRYFRPLSRRLLPSFVFKPLLYYPLPRPR